MKRELLSLWAVLFLAQVQGPACGQSWGQFKQAALDAESAGDAGGAEGLWRKALEAASADGEAGARYFASLAGLAGALSRAGKNSEATPLYEKIVAERAKQGSSEELDAGVTAYIELLKKSGLPEKAQELEDRFKLKAKTAEAQNTSKDNAATVNDPWVSVTEKGCQSLQSKLYPAAESHFREALALAEKENDSNKMSDSLARLVHLLCVEKRFAQAEPLQARRTALVHKLSGGGSAEYANALLVHGKLLRKINRVSEAINSEGKAESILAQKGGGGDGSPMGGQSVAAVDSPYVNKGGAGTRGGSIYSRAQSAAQSGGTGGSFADLMQDLMNQ